MYLQN